MKLVRFCVLALCCICAFNSYGKENVSYSKEEKKVKKDLKSRYKPKSIELMTGEDGFKYFILTHKDGTYFAADSTGRLIVPYDEKFEYILYIPESDEAKNTYIRNSWGYCGNLQSIPVERTFIASQNYRSDFLKGVAENPTFFYDDKGDLIKVYDERLQSFGDNLFTISSLSNNGNYEYGLISADGKVLIPKCYKYIYPSASLGHWIIQLSDDGITRSGLYSTTEKKIIIPPLFDRVEQAIDGTYMVAMTTFDTLAPYDASKSYELSFPDLGAKLFYQGKYEDVISYYQRNDTIPLGIVLSNISYYKLSSSYKSSYDQDLAYIKGFDYSADPTQTLYNNFNRLKQTITEWNKYHNDLPVTINIDLFPQYKAIYNESINFLDWNFKSCDRMEREMNMHIDSFCERKSQYEIAEKERYEHERYERQRLERERREAERDRKYYEMERRRREEENRRRLYEKQTKSPQNNKNHNNDNRKSGQHPGATPRNNNQQNNHPAPPPPRKNTNNSNNNNKNNTNSSPANKPDNYITKPQDNQQKKNPADTKEKLKTDN